MTQNELKKLLEMLVALPKETEWVEFKEAKNTYDFDRIGKYFSALSNEANLKEKEFAWFVFGVEDKTRKIVGTSYRTNRGDLDSLKGEIANKTTHRITFIEIHELQLPEGRVIMFQIPSAPKGIPIAWEGHYYGRDGEVIGALNIQEIEQIRGQVREEDWSAQICDGATINDLDENAIMVARKRFKEKNPKLIEESEQWTDTVFLDKAKLTKVGRITNAVIILLGKAESDHYLSPSVAKITWVLKDEKDNETDYEHFSPPFLLQVDKVYGKIRNLKQRILPKGSGTLFPIETTMYEEWVIREALNNCIAHQDYTLHGRINVVEKPTEIIFTNLGSFIPIDVEKFIQQDIPPERYRNRLLAEAMVNLNMIDTIGGGIKKMYNKQRDRFFPLPDYDLSDPQKVQVRLHGQIIDENYTRILMENLDLDLKTVILLDKVQKKHTIAREDGKELKKQKLVEGRYPNLFISAHVAQITDKKAAYTKSKGFDKDYYKDLIVKFISQHGQSSRKEINELLWAKLPEILTEKQKKVKINNIISELSRTKVIFNDGTSHKPVWKLVK